MINTLTSDKLLSSRLFKRYQETTNDEISIIINNLIRKATKFIGIIEIIIIIESRVCMNNIGIGNTNKSQQMINMY